MSVDLVFVWSDGPDRLEGELLRRREACGLGPAVLSAQLDPLALPQGERGGELARDVAWERVFDVIVAGAGNPALAKLVCRAGVPAKPGRVPAATLLPQGVQLGAQRPFAVQRARRRPPRQPELEAADLGAETRVGVRAVQPGGADLHIGRARELPEVEHVQEVRRPPATAEQGFVAGAPGHLSGELVGAEAAEGAVQRYPRAGEAVLAEVRPERERILGLGHRVQVPAVQLAKLLAKLSDVEPDVSRQPGPVGVALLDADLPVLEAHEDLRIRIGV